MKRLIKKAETPTLETFLPDYDPMEYDFINLGIQTVNVSDIVGMSNGRNEEYNSDWTPINKNDSRWDYQKNLIEQGGEMEAIPLIKMPNGKYTGNGDGSHRISVAKFLGLQTVSARVSAMVHKDNGIGESWEQYAAEDINKLTELEKKYQILMKKFPSVQDKAWETGDKKEYNKLNAEIVKIGDEMSTLDNRLRKEEDEYKCNMLSQKV